MRCIYNNNYTPFQTIVNTFFKMYNKFKKVGELRRFNIMNYIQKIVEIRKEKNISQADMAKILNTTQQQISKYENEIQELPVRHLIAIAKALNVSIDYLVGLNEKKN